MGVMVVVVVVQVSVQLYDMTLRLLWGCVV